MRELAGKVALVTGGASGIGLALTKALAAAGMRVTKTYRTGAHLAEAQECFRAHPEWQIHPLHLDVTDRDEVRDAADEVERVFGKIHLLCNNAGVNLMGPMDVATFDDWDWIMGVNLNGVINTLVTFLPRIKAHGEGGHVVNVASMAAFITGPASGIYCASKFAVRGLSESLQLSLAPHRIGVSLVCPGLTQSRIFEAPSRRPKDLANTAFPANPQTTRRLEEVHAFGMDAQVVASRTIEAILRNEFYVFSHPEFRDEMRELAQEIDVAFRDEPADPRRLAFEVTRRQVKARARAQVE